MTGENTDIREAIRMLSGFNDIEFESILGTVSDINITDLTCTCTPIDGGEGSEYLDVLLSVDKKNGFVLIPKDGSLVIISQVNDVDCFISMVSEVDNIYLISDTYGGLVKVIDLTTKLNNLENKMNLVLTFLAGLGATPPLTTPLTPTVRADIENEKIKHG